MEEQESRTELLIGREAIQRLRKSHVMLVGLGGVGSYAAEALARAGVGRLTLIDGDVVAESNLNRQLLALHSTLGRAKAEVMAERIADIDPRIQVRAMPLFYAEETEKQVDFSDVDYVADAIDSVPSKLLLIRRARQAGVPVISCMGAGNKLDPTRFEVADLEKTAVCPLAKLVRTALRKEGITGVKAVFSREEPCVPQTRVSGSRTIGSISFVPSAAGLIMAGEIICTIAKGKIEVG